MISKLNSKRSNSVSRFLGNAPSNHRSHADRLSRSHGPTCEALEARVVLSSWGMGGNDFLGSLASAGVVTSAEVGGPARSYDSPWASQSSAVTQLNTDLQKLQTELQSLAAKSGITIVDMTNLTTDSRSIAGAGFWINPENLQKSVSELVTAVASGSSTTQAKTDFNAIFTGSNVAQTTIDKTFNDLVQTIQDSKITAADLSAVAADEATIQTDLNNLPVNGREFGSVSSLTEGGGSLTSNLATSLSIAGVATLPAQSTVAQGSLASWSSSSNTAAYSTQYRHAETPDRRAVSGVQVGSDRRRPDQPGHR